MSECGPDCPCPDHQARKLLVRNDLGMVAQKRKMIEALAILIENSKGKCPQSCGQIWPECGCPTIGMKDLYLKMSEAGKHLKRRGSRGLSIMEMMVSKGAETPTRPEPGSAEAAPDSSGRPAKKGSPCGEP